MDTQNNETSSKVRDLAEKSVEQARGAIDTLLEAARSTSDAIQSTTKTGDSAPGLAVSKGFGFAKENISAIFDFAQQLVRAPDLKQAAQLQAEFVKQQASVMEKQVAELKTLGDKTS
jgi:hypothetical protein